MSGGYCMLESLMHGKVLNVEGARGESGTPVIMWSKEHGPPPNELWRFEPAQGDQFWIASALNPNLVLDVEGARAEPGARIILYDRSYPPAANQLWRWDGHQLMSCLSGGGLALDIENADRNDGARAILWNRKYGGDSSNQSWRYA